MMHPRALRRFAAAFTFLLLSAGSAAAAEEIETAALDGAAIRQVIAGQIEAFRRDDGDAAFALASPGVQIKFNDPDTFMEMVRTGYAPVYRPKDVTFRDLVLLEGTPIQEVQVIGPDGDEFMALYFMELQSDGSWRISGCTLLAPPGVTVQRPLSAGTRLG